MELAWNAQKNQITDVKGKENEQERKGEIRNDDIDLERTKNNYDLVESEKNLYQRVKQRVDELKENGSRVQKNSVVMYSNILTVPQEQAEKWGEQKTDDYFKACYEFFCEEFGKENVVSGKIHKDETAPHMHLHFVPVNKENGKLQARVA
ncbi:MobV family relaxase, partial [Priestia aryabhattai]|uniref:MobV family relaxase n=1 Tax=Priestia aryabhattai TaxID=412384 RepID=UPI002E1FC33C